jgi:hypothetical protein
MVVQKPRQLRAFVTTCGNTSQTVNCVVDLEGLELRARHAVRSNRSLGWSGQRFRFKRRPRMEQSDQGSPNSSVAILRGLNVAGSFKRHGPARAARPCYRSAFRPCRKGRRDFAEL